MQAYSAPAPVRPRRAAAYHKPARHARTPRRSQAALSMVCGSSSREEAASLAGTCSIVLDPACMCPHAEVCTDGWDPCCCRFRQGGYRGRRCQCALQRARWQPGLMRAGCGHEYRLDCGCARLLLCSCRSLRPPVGRTPWCLRLALATSWAIRCFRWQHCVLAHVCLQRGRQGMSAAALTSHPVPLSISMFQHITVHPHAAPSGHRSRWIRPFKLCTRQGSQGSMAS